MAERAQPCRDTRDVLVHVVRLRPRERRHETDAHSSSVAPSAPPGPGPAVAQGERERPERGCGDHSGAAERPDAGPGEHRLPRPGGELRRRPVPGEQAELVPDAPPVDVGGVDGLRPGEEHGGRRHDRGGSKDSCRRPPAGEGRRQADSQERQRRDEEARPRGVAAVGVLVAELEQEEERRHRQRTRATPHGYRRARGEPARREPGRAPGRRRGGRGCRPARAEPRAPTGRGYRRTRLPAPRRTAPRHSVGEVERRAERGPVVERRAARPRERTPERRSGRACAPPASARVRRRPRAATRPIWYSIVQPEPGDDAGPARTATPGEHERREPDRRRRHLVEVVHRERGGERPSGEGHERRAAPARGEALRDAPHAGTRTEGAPDLPSRTGRARGADRPRACHRRGSSPTATAAGTARNETPGALSVYRDARRTRRGPTVPARHVSAERWPAGSPGPRTSARCPAPLPDARRGACRPRPARAGGARGEAVARRSESAGGGTASRWAVIYERMRSVLVRYAAADAALRSRDRSLAPRGRPAPRQSHPRLLRGRNRLDPRLLGRRDAAPKPVRLHARPADPGARGLQARAGRRARE